MNGCWQMIKVTPKLQSQSKVLDTWTVCKVGPYLTPLHPNPPYNNVPACVVSTYTNEWRFLWKVLGSLSTHAFETQTATGREHSVCQDSGVSHIFIPIIHNREKVLRIVNVMVWRRVIRENSSLPLAVRVWKSRVLKLPIIYYYGTWTVRQNIHCLGKSCPNFIC